jgi:hypothetical protein
MKVIQDPHHKKEEISGCLTSLSQSIAFCLTDFQIPDR